MEENIISSGTIKMDHADISQAALTYLTKKQNLLKTAITDYLLNVKGYRITKLIFNQQENGVMSVIAEVHSAPSVPRPNRGFFTFLIDYLRQQKRKGYKTVDYDLVYEAVHKEFPTISLPKFGIYCSNKSHEGYKIKTLSGKGVKGDPYKRVFVL